MSRRQKLYSMKEWEGVDGGASSLLAVIQQRKEQKNTPIKIIQL